MTAEGRRSKKNDESSGDGAQRLLLPRLHVVLDRKGNEKDDVRWNRLRGARAQITIDWTGEKEANAAAAAVASARFFKETDICCL